MTTEEQATTPPSKPLSVDQLALVGVLVHYNGQSPDDARDVALRGGAELAQQVRLLIHHDPGNTFPAIAASVKDCCEKFFAKPSGQFSQLIAGTREGGI